ncbi:MAG TPA: hypothetical protein VF201_11570 [Nitrolancea sp.]
MTGQSRRQPTKSTNHGRRWFTVLITIAIAVLLVVFGAQLAHGPSKNNVEASTLATTVSTPATAVAGVATPEPTRQPMPTATAVTPTFTAAATTQAAATPPNPTITEGASIEATSAIARFVQQNGTTLHLGSATSAPFTSDATGVVGQYFANAVLEYHPEFAGTPYDVELSRVGVALASANGVQQSAPFEPLAASTQGDANCWFVHATRHRLCGGFRDFWRSQGLDLGDPGVSYRESLALFGYPISEEFIDPATGLTVQYFERGVLTYDGSKAPSDRIREQTSTEAILNRWHFQIIAGAASLPGGG